MGIDAGFLALLGTVLVIGVLAVITVFLLARGRDRRRAEELVAPPSRDIPHFEPGQVKPRYLSELESRQEPVGAVTTDLTDDERATLQGELDSAPVRLDAGWVMREFATDRASGWAVLDDARVAVLAEGASSFREMMALAEVATRVPLLIVAPTLDGDVVETLRANRTQRLMRVCCAVAPAEDCLALARELGVEPLSRADLQSGWIGQLAKCRRVVCGSGRTWVWLDGLEPIERGEARSASAGELRAPAETDPA